MRACVEGDVIATASWELHMGNARGFDRIEGLCNQLHAAIRSRGAQFAVIEGYAYGNRYTLVSLVEISTAYRLLLRRIGVPYVVVAPTMLKKFFTGKGNANKEAMLTVAKDEWGFAGTDNEVDAFALALFGACLAGHLDSTSRQAEAITRWKGENANEIIQLSPYLLTR